MVIMTKWLVEVTLGGTAVSARPDFEIKTLGNALNVLDRLAEQDERGLRLPDIAKATEVSELTVQRVLNTLLSHGYLTLDTSSGAYSLSAKWLRASARFRMQSDIRRVTVPHLAQLADSFEVCASVAIEWSGGIMWLDRVMAPALHAIFGPSGTPVAWYASAAGKVFAAAKDASVISEYLKNAPLMPLTPSTIDRKSVV